MSYLIAQGAELLHLLGSQGSPVSLFSLIFPSF